MRTQLESADTLKVDPYVDSFDDVPLLATVPTSGSITEEERIESIDAVRWTLSNGITVIAKQTDFRNDEVVFGAYSPGGHSLVADTDHFSALYAAVLVGGSGAGPHDNVTLDKLLAGKQVSVSPYIRELFEGFSGSASPEDMETLFQLITLYATEPRLDPVFFERYQSALRSLAETRSAQPDALFSDTVNTVLSQGHLRRRPLTLELLEEFSSERGGSGVCRPVCGFGRRDLRFCRRLRLGKSAVIDLPRIWPACRPPAASSSGGTSASTHRWGWRTTSSSAG